MHTQDPTIEGPVDAKEAKTKKIYFFITTRADPFEKTRGFLRILKKMVLKRLQSAGATDES